jgi:hypothetical protein
VEPVRVKVYGLFARTRRHYLLDSIVGFVFVMALLAAWWLGWPRLRLRMTALPLPPFYRTIVLILDRAPWILLAASLWKGMEVAFVLRSFARKEVSNRLKESDTPT